MPVSPRDDRSRRPPPGGRASRQPWLDSLRIAAGGAVVALHVSGFAFRDFSRGADAAWWAGNIVNSASRWCVPVFVMISGALLLGRPPGEPAGRFLARRALRLGPALVVWPLVYLLYRRLATPHPPDLAGALRAWLWDGTAFYHLWFLYMIAGLYAVTPLLGAWRRRAGTAGQAVAIGLAFLAHLRWPVTLPLVGEGPLLAWPEAPIWLTSWPPYLGYYLLGALLVERRPPSRPTPWLAAAGAAVAATVLASWALASRAGGISAARAVQDNLSPLVVLAAASLFLAARSQPGWTLAGRWQAPMADAVLGVYMVHPLVIEALWRLGLGVATFPPGVGVVVVSLLVAALAAGVTWLLRQVPGLRRAV